MKQSEQSVGSRLQEAAVSALVFSVKAVIVIVSIGLALYALAGDYAAVRAGAGKGAAAYDYIQKVNEAQSKQASAPAVVPAPAAK